MELWQAVVLGLVEGITEYLPVSSTGHLIIATSLMGLDADERSRAAVNAFTIVIQGGAILAVLGLYWPRVLQMLRGVLGRDAAGRQLALNIIVAFLPAAVFGPLLDEAIERVLFHPWPVVAALAAGGVLMIVVGRGRDDDKRRDITDLTLRGALLIGALQCLAMWPGVSRSMMAIVGGVLVGLRPRQAAEFSFLLGLPTLGGACVYRLAKDLRSDGPSMFELLGVAPIIVGIVVATISAALAVRWLVGFVSRHGLAPFGWYRIALAAALAALFLGGVVSF